MHDLTLTQIRTLDCGKLLDDFPEAEVVSGNEIAILPQVFELADSYGADVRFNVETKVDKVEIQSFDWRTLPMVRAAEPSTPWWHCGMTPPTYPDRRGWTA